MILNAHSETLDLEKQNLLGSILVANASLGLILMCGVLLGAELLGYMFTPSPIVPLAVLAACTGVWYIYARASITLQQRVTVGLALLVTALQAAAVYLNGVLGFSFLPIYLLIMTALYRDQYVLWAPCIGLAMIGLALAVTPQFHSFDYEIRLLIFGVLLIYPVHQLFSAARLSSVEKSGIAAWVFGALALVTLGMTIERLVDPQATLAQTATLFMTAFILFVCCLICRRNRIKEKVIVVALNVVGYSLAVMADNIMPMTALPVAVLVNFLLLTPFNAIMLSLGFTLVSLLGLFSGEVILVERIPIAMRLFGAGLITIFLFATLFRTRERELGEQSVSVVSITKMLPVALVATFATSLLTFDGFHAENGFLQSGLKAHEMKEIIGFVLMFLIFLWGFSALYHQSEVARSLATNLQSSLRETELALKAGEIGIVELDVESGVATLRAGDHPSLAKGQSFNIDDFAKQVVLDSSAIDIANTLRQENAHLQFSVLYPGSEKPRWIQITTGEHVKIDGRVKSVYVRSDITRMRESHEALRLAKEKQRDLFAVVGHELRTPVASMQMIMQDASTSDSEKLNLLEDINTHLLDVLEDMRGVVSPERAKQAAVVVSNPVSLVQRALTPLSELVSKNHIKLHSSYADRLDIDFRYRAQALRQIVTNLVKNAAIHSEGANIWVELSLVTEDKRTTTLSLKVEDDGKGIPPEDVERVFDAFVRGQTDKDGSGLGLYIATELAARLGGTLTYSPREAGGSCFSLSFVAECLNSEPQEQAETTEIECFKGMRILLAEDDKMLRMLTHKTLVKQGAIVTVCNDGQAAEECFANSQYDLVLTDLMMPRMSGLELIKSLRGSGATLPIIAITAAVIGSETDELLAAGANAVISKPITVQKLTETISGFERRGPSA